MTDRYDAIIVGAGHNGLVCATRLARAGKSVLVLEANETPGGAVATHEFAPGFRASTCAQFLYQLQPAVVEGLGLKLPESSPALATISLSPDGSHVRIDGENVVGVSADDRDEYRRFHAQTRRFARFLNRQFMRPPPRIGSGRRHDTVALARAAVELRRLGRRDMRDFLRLITASIHDDLEERFESALLSGAIALDAVLGTHSGPRSPGTLATLLHRYATGGACRLPAGGMGALSAALAETAVRAGVDLRLGTPVASVLVDNGRATGVVVADGNRYDSLTVISNVDPKTLVLELVGAEHFEAGFVKRIRNLRAAGNAARLHLALSRLPSVDGLDIGDLGQRLLIAGDPGRIEQAFNPAKYGEFSAAPVVEFCIPSLADSRLAPDGRHVLSATVQYAPAERRGGWDDEARAAFESAAIDTLETCLPGLSDAIEASELLLPLDIADRFGNHGGHWHHAELALDQFMFVRPVAGAAQCALPLDGLFICGAGAHPGGGVSGAAGWNAANVLLDRDKPGWR